jgi:hypothetical protein
VSEGHIVLRLTLSSASAQTNMDVRLPLRQVDLATHQAVQASYFYTSSDPTLFVAVPPSLIEGSPELALPVVALRALLPSLQPLSETDAVDRWRWSGRHRPAVLRGLAATF